MGLQAGGWAAGGERGNQSSEWRGGGWGGGAARAWAKFGPRPRNGKTPLIPGTEAALRHPLS